MNYILENEIPLRGNRSCIINVENCVKIIDVHLRQTYYYILIIFSFAFERTFSHILVDMYIEI